MTDFTGSFKQVSDNNFYDVLQELGVEDKIIAKMNQIKPSFNITKTDAVYTYTLVFPHVTTQFNYELGKEFDLEFFNGIFLQTIIVADGNKLIQTHVTGDKVMKVIREFNDDEVVVTISIGSAIGSAVYKRE